MNLIPQIIMNEENTNIFTSSVEKNKMYSGEDYSTELEPVISVSRVKTPEFLKSLLNKGNSERIFPKNCRYYNENSERIFMIIEEPPAVRSITVSIDLTAAIEEHKMTGKYEKYDLNSYLKTQKDAPRIYRFMLSFPYIVHKFNMNVDLNMNYMKTFYRLSPVSTIKDYLFEPNLPNISPSHGVCLGDYNHQEFTSLSDATDFYLNMFWTNHFNKDYLSHYKKYQSVDDINDFFTWQYNSLVNPMFIFNIKWIVAEENLEMQNDYTQDLSMRKLINDVTNINRKSNSVGYSSRLYSDSVNVGDYLLYVGDSLVLDEKKYYIYTISYDYPEYGETTIELEDENGELKYFKLTREFKGKILAENSKQNQSLEIVYNGSTIKEGDLVLHNQNGSINKIEKIRKNLYGEYEVKIYNNFYLLSAFDKKVLTVFNQDEMHLILANGRKILFKKGEYYSLIIQNSYDRVSKLIFNGRFDGLMFDGGYLTVAFTNKKEQSIKISHDNFKRFVMELNEIEGMLETQIFMDGDTVLASPIPFYYKKGTGIIREVDDFYLVTRSISANSDYADTFSLVQYANYWAETGKMYIPTNNLDISFEVGDEVIVIDWDYPEEMLNIRKIKSFNVKKDHFNFILEDKNGVVISHPYINLKNRKISGGKIRKVTHKLDNIEVGMKVVANDTRIKDFPKKDVNEIAAIIVDDIIPVILFRNGRTQFLPFLLKNFKIFPNNYKKDSVNTIDKKIATLAGDLFEIKWNKQVVASVKYVANSNPVNILTSYFPNFETFNHITFTSLKRYGLLYPRISHSEYYNTRGLYCKIGFNAYFTLAHSSRIYLRRDWSNYNEIDNDVIKNELRIANIGLIEPLNEEQEDGDF